MARFLFVFGLTYLCFVRGQSNSDCTTPTRQKGQCIPLNECTPLWNIVQNPTISQENVELLRNSQCGPYIPKYPPVCCEDDTKATEENLQCFTPDGSEGICKGLFSCPTLFSIFTPQLTNEIKNYVKLSRCESPSKYGVCCGPPMKEGVIPIRDCPTSAAPPDPRTECCGLDGFSGNKIFGGEVTGIDQYPWMAMVEYLGKRDTKLKLLCGGVLISGKYVLTAGHCVKGPVLNIGTPANVRLGEYDTGNDGPDCVQVEGGGKDCNTGSLTIPIEKVIPHPKYESTSSLRRDDIAILRLKEYAPYTDFIRPICLPTSDIAEEVDTARTLYAAGWGAVSDQQSFSNIKLHVGLPYKSMEECQPAYNVSKRKVPLWNGQLCAGGIAAKDSCKGDSGGPLMSDNGRIFQVVGIVSFGPTPCGIENVPGVYTKVYAYLPWIRSQLKP